MLLVAAKSGDATKTRVMLSGHMSYNLHRSHAVAWTT